MRSHLRWVTGVACAAAVGAFASSARADSESPPPNCAVQVFPASLLPVPANAPALLVLDSSSQAVATLQGSLSTADGTVITLPAATADGNLPAGTTDGKRSKILTLPPLKPGRTYDVAVALSCSAPHTVPSTVRSRFIASEASPLPTRTGTLRTEENNPLRFLLDPSQELAAYSTVSTLTWAVGATNQGTLRGPVDPKKISFEPLLGAACFRSDGSRLTGKTTTIVSLSAHVAGATSDPQPATLDVPVDCPLPAQTDGSSDANRGCRVSADGRHPTFDFAAIALALGIAVRRRSRSTTRS